MKIFITTVVILAIIIVGAYFLWPTNPKPVVTDFKTCVEAGYPVLESFPEQCKTADGTTFIKDGAETTSGTTATPGGSTNPDVPIFVKNVIANQIIESGFVVHGEAKGNWYFEGSFPVTLLDANGKKLIETYATADENWMTTSFVPFTSKQLLFTKPTTATGTLVLHNDNASGLKENDKEIRIQVRFTAIQKSVKLYYYNASKDTNGVSKDILCSAKGLVPVNRTISTTITPIQDTLRALFEGGATPAESQAGIVSNFPLAGVVLTGASLSNGVLTINLTDPQHNTGGGACRINVLRAQIEATAKQFPEVKEVRIMPATVFQP